MNKLQETQLEILLAVTKVLDENNFSYNLSGGTCLGAVRHKGFIPWDDDIDINMPREDYEKFAKIANDILPKEYFYQDKNTDKEYPYNFAKIRKNGTLFLQKPLKDFNMHHGVYIDIFPLDGASNSIKTATKHLKKCIFYNYMSIIDTFKNTYKKLPLKKRIGVVVLKFLRFIIGKKRVEKKLYKLTTKYSVNDSMYIGNLFFRYHKKGLIDKSYFYSDTQKYSLVSFEGYDFKAPVNTDQYLTFLFGDYMKLPPVEKQVSDHQVIKVEC